MDGSPSSRIAPAVISAPAGRMFMMSPKDRLFLDCVELEGKVIPVGPREQSMLEPRCLLAKLFAFEAMLTVQHSSPGTRAIGDGGTAAVWRSTDSAVQVVVGRQVRKLNCDG